jgi:short-subunit dehydrogenase
MRRPAPARRMQLRDRTAVITGAASGIGRAVALSLARRGCHLALVDRDETGLGETAASAAASGVRVSRHTLDVTDRAAIAALPAAVVAEHPGVDLLVNNAGVALSGTFEQVEETAFEWLFEVNFWAVVRMARAFLPLLRVSDDARLVNVSSVFGLVSPPGQAAYSASKFAVRGFSQALRLELAGTSVGVTVVHPGGVATSIAKNARAAPSLTPEEIARVRERAQQHLRMPPEQAGEIIVRGIERRRPRVIVGNDAKIIAVLERVLPVSHMKLLFRPQARR